MEWDQLVVLQLIKYVHPGVVRFNLGDLINARVGYLRSTAWKQIICTSCKKTSRGIIFSHNKT